MALKWMMSSSPNIYPGQACVGRCEDFTELPVPAHQLQLLVEHRDSLAHMVERGLEDFTVVVDCGACIVEELESGLGGNRAFAQEQRQHQPRRRRSDRGGEKVLCIAQQLEVRPRFRVDIKSAC